MTSINITFRPSGEYLLYCGPDLGVIYQTTFQKEKPMELMLLIGIIVNLLKRLVNAILGMLTFYERYIPILPIISGEYGEELKNRTNIQNFKDKDFFSLKKVVKVIGKYPNSPCFSLMIEAIL